jgi:outer membrane receptor protein involved in Fe transport
VTTGNRNLVPEEADTKTFGISWQPAFLDGFRASVDYYDISLSGGITARTGQVIVNRCFGQNGNPLTPADCQLIDRDPVSGRIVAVNTFPINDQEQETRGIDYEIAYGTNVGAGALNVRLLTTQLMRLMVLGVNRAGEIGTGTSSPRWRGTLSASYAQGPWTLFGQTRYIDNGTYDDTFGPMAIADNEIASRTYVDASVQYEFGSQSFERLQLFARVSNLFDKEPPVLANANQNAAPTNVALYDVAGRSFAVGMRVDF